MDTRRTTQISKFLSLVLRHQPEKIGITLDSAGWVDVEDLLHALNTNGFAVSEPELREVVDTSEKQRFAFSEDDERIRASQGHSVDVELGYPPAPPPDVLYHGTVERALESIRKSGLIKGSRHHVHLSGDVTTAEKVGQRRGPPIILIIHSAPMQAAGFQFFVSANGVWLTDHVPPQYIDFP